MRLPSERSREQSEPREHRLYRGNFKFGRENFKVWHLKLRRLTSRENMFARVRSPVDAIDGISSFVSLFLLFFWVKTKCFSYPLRSIVWKGYPFLWKNLISKWRNTLKSLTLNIVNAFDLCRSLIDSFSANILSSGANFCLKSITVVIMKCNRVFRWKSLTSFESCMYWQCIWKKCRGTFSLLLGT